METVNIEELVQDRHNFNKGTDEGSRLMEKSFTELGAGRSILIDKDGNIIAGNKSQLAAMKAGIKKVRVIESDGSELIAVKRTDVAIDSKKGRELALADNLTTQVNLSWDEAELETVATEQGIDLPDWGLDPAELGLQEPEEAKDVQEDDFDEEKDKVETVCKKGDIWLLGKHRLMCGSCTDADSMARLMDGQRADIAFTSPPYGVNDGSLREHKVAGQSSHADKNFYEEHDDNMGTWPALIENSWQQMHEHSIQQFINVQMLADNKRELLKWAARHAEYFVDMLIWNKVNAAPQMQPNIVNNVYENIYVFGDKNADRKLKFGAFHGNVGAIIEAKVGNNEYAKIHKAVFPVALPARIMEINANASTILDCFGGTGTTMIAAEQLNRKCYMMELDPHYCDVIIARWEKLTGQKATRL